jgi:ABC-type branched-subunit amino acid transport system substrate-binding protein
MRRRGRGVTVAVLASVALLAASCGARLSASQLAALNASSNSGQAATGNGNGNAAVTATNGTQALNGSGTQPAALGSTASNAATQRSGSSTRSGSTAAQGSSGQGGPATVGVQAARTCSSAPVRNTPGVSASEIDVGNVSTLTGPVPGLFLGAQHGIEAFAQYIDSTGGICGRRLVVKSADDNLDASQNATATQSLANSVLAFVGSFSVDDQGGAATLREDDVPDIGEALSPQRFDLPNNFSPQPQPVGWNLAPFIYFKQRFGPNVISHMALFIENNSTAQQQGFAQRDAMESLGYKFIFEEDAIEPTQSDFSAEVAKMKSKGVKGIIFEATAQIYADMAKDMYNVGFSVPFANWGAPAYDPAFTQGSGPGANGAVLNQAEAMYEGQDANSVPEVGLFDRYYQALYGGSPNLFAAFGWMSGELFVEGLDAGGTPTRSALLAGLKTITKFDANGMVAENNPAGKVPPNCYLVIDVSNGKFLRDPTDPRTGFDCADTPDFWYSKP